MFGPFFAPGYFARTYFPGPSGDGGAGVPTIIDADGEYVDVLSADGSYIPIFEHDGEGQPEE